MNDLRFQLRKFLALLVVSGLVGHALAQDSDAPPLDPSVAVSVSALEKIQGDVESNPKLKSVVLKVLEKTRGTDHFVSIVKKFKIQGQEEGLLDLARKRPNSEAGMQAVRILGEEQKLEIINKSLVSGEKLERQNLLTAIGNVREKSFVPLLFSFFTNSSNEAVLRKQSIRSLAGTQEGSAGLLKLARAEQIADEFKFTAATELNAVRWEEIKQDAARLLPLPESHGSSPLPSLAELLKMPSDAIRGEKVFFKAESACSSCHQVFGKGIEVGPNLSEIGSKLPREALVESILDPSAGISFGFELFNIETKSGDEAAGIIVSETADEISLKDAKGLVLKYKKSDLTRREKMKQSIMPTGLQATMSTQEFVDLIAYLSELKKK